MEQRRLFRFQKDRQDQDKLPSLDRNFLAIFATLAKLDIFHFFRVLLVSPVMEIDKSDAPLGPQSP